MLGGEGGVTPEPTSWWAEGASEELKDAFLAHQVASSPLPPSATLPCSQAEIGDTLRILHPKLKPFRTASSPFHRALASD